MPVQMKNIPFKYEMQKKATFVHKSIVMKIQSMPKKPKDYDYLQVRKQSTAT
jgi:hypothetical protein